jgi:hypothetical protein
MSGHASSSLARESDLLAFQIAIERVDVQARAGEAILNRLRWVRATSHQGRR